MCGVMSPRTGTIAGAEGSGIAHRQLSKLNEVGLERTCTNSLGDKMPVTTPVCAALLALGVSYTNELDASRALDHLRLWLRRHPDFASLAPAEEEAQLAPRACP